MEEPKLVKDKALRKRYLSIFIPKVLASEAKKIGVKPTDKKAMNALKLDVRLRLRQRFDCIPLEQILEDIKNQGKDVNIKISMTTVHHMNYSYNNKICSRLNLPDEKLNWIKKTRKELLKKAPEYVCKLESMFWLHKEAAYQRYPFKEGRDVYFATLYIPGSDTIIEFPPKYKEGSKRWLDTQMRLSILRSQCKNLIELDTEDIDMERFRTEILPVCAKNVVLGPLGQPMNKIG